MVHAETNAGFVLCVALMLEGGTQGFSGHGNIQHQWAQGKDEAVHHQWMVAAWQDPNPILPLLLPLHLTLPLTQTPSGLNIPSRLCRSIWGSQHVHPLCVVGWRQKSLPAPKQETVPKPWASLCPAPCARLTSSSKHPHSQQSRAAPDLRHSGTLRSQGQCRVWSSAGECFPTQTWCPVGTLGLSSSQLNALRWPNNPICSSRVDQLVTPWGSRIPLGEIGETQGDGPLSNSHPVTCTP